MPIKRVVYALMDAAMKYWPGSGLAAEQTRPEMMSRESEAKRTPTYGPSDRLH